MRTPVLRHSIDGITLSYGKGQEDRAHFRAMGGDLAASAAACATPDELVCAAAVSRLLSGRGFGDVGAAMS